MGTSEPRRSGGRSGRRGGAPIFSQGASSCDAPPPACCDEKNILTRIGASVGGPRATRREADARPRWRRGGVAAWRRGRRRQPRTSARKEVLAGHVHVHGHRRRLWMAHGERLVAREPAERSAVVWPPMPSRAPWPPLRGFSPRSGRTPSRQSLQSLAQRRRCCQWPRRFSVAACNP